MAGIVLPRRLRAQPQSAVPLNNGNKFRNRIKFAYSVGRGLHDGAHGRGSVIGTMTYSVGLRGRNVQPTDDTSYLSFADNSDYNIVGGITVGALITVGGTTIQQHILSKTLGGGGSDTPWAIGLEVDGYIFLNRANSGGFRVWRSGTPVPTGATVAIWATQGADISVAPKFYIAGVLDTVAPTNLFGGGGAGAPTANTQPVRIGNRTDLAARYYGVVYDGVVLNGVLSDSEIAEYTYDQYAIWQAPARRLWSVATVGAIIGTVAYTNLDDTSSATGTTTVTGSSATANANDTSAASGTTTVTGSSATTNANDTVSASGSPIIVGTSATTNADDTVAASGAVGSAVTGSAAYTNIDDTASASGTTTVTGSAAVTNTDDTASASGTTTVTGTSATTNANDICAASGEVSAAEVTGTVAYTNADDIASAAGTTTIKGSAAVTNANDTANATGTVNNGITVEAALTTGIVQADRIKKPGIPTGTADWLKTFLEIIVGRRGNKIAVPAQQDLTFSATPTQAECEALHAYTNEVRAAVNKIITRLDS